MIIINFPTKTASLSKPSFGTSLWQNLLNEKIIRGINAKIIMKQKTTDTVFGNDMKYKL